MIETRPTPAPDTRRAQLVEWRCDACHKLLLELDPGRPSFLRKVCERCKHTNLWVEAYTVRA